MIRDVKGEKKMIPKEKNSLNIFSRALVVVIEKKFDSIKNDVENYDGSESSY